MLTTIPATAEYTCLRMTAFLNDLLYFISICTGLLFTFFLSLSPPRWPSPLSSPPAAANSLSFSISLAISAKLGTSLFSSLLLFFRARSIPSMALSAPSSRSRHHATSSSPSSFRALAELSCSSSSFLVTRHVSSSLCSDLHRFSDSSRVLEAFSSRSFASTYRPSSYRIVASASSSLVRREATSSFNDLMVAASARRSASLPVAISTLTCSRFLNS
mmetsp:Transcript_53109/g.112864  ORF Transcript_53109/g.112864 Transcript_53109/m.112864 type:complete len:217 (-) Transcript_53109:1389-2039(-)